jgi:hypothetical protein
MRRTCTWDGLGEFRTRNTIAKCAYMVMRMRVSRGL